MALELGIVLDQLRKDGSIELVARNPRAQFGVPTRQYLGATILPEVTVNDNSFREENIRYRTVIANDGSRYSPVQRKRGELFASFLVELGDSDIGAELSGREYETLLRILDANVSMEAAAQILNWTDIRLTRALVENCEKQRWEAIVNAAVVRKGNNGYRETVQYTNPSGHRVNAAGTWSDDAYDPYQDIVAMVNLLEGKGYRVSRIITKRAVLSILSLNEKMRQRGGLTTLSPGILAGVAPGYIDIAMLNNIFQRDGLPAIEEYNLQYRYGAGSTATSAPFLPGNTMVFVCESGRDETLDLGDEVKTVTNTLGYHAIGKATAQTTPGRVVKLFSYDRRPPRIEGEGYQTHLPVITEPEAFAVIKNIS